MTDQTAEEKYIRREMFLRRAAEAEMKALSAGDPEYKLAWADIACAWNTLAREIPRNGAKQALGARLQRLARGEGQAVN